MFTYKTQWPNHVHSQAGSAQARLRWRHQVAPQPLVHFMVHYGDQLQAHLEKGMPHPVDSQKTSYGVKLYWQGLKVWDHFLKVSVHFTWAWTVGIVILFNGLDKWMPYFYLLVQNRFRRMFSDRQNNLEPLCFVFKRWYWKDEKPETLQY